MNLVLRFRLYNFMEPTAAKNIDYFLKSEFSRTVLPPLFHRHVLSWNAKSNINKWSLTMAQAVLGAKPW